MDKEQEESDQPIADIRTYRLDVYRLLTMLLADKQVAQDKEFSALGNHFMESEANRLLAIIALSSRQFLDFLSRLDVKKEQEFSKASCGKLNFRRACNVIIHATDIAFYKVQDEVSSPLGGSIIEYFESIITITRIKKRGSELQKIELEFNRYAKTCILLSNHLLKQRNIDHAYPENGL